MALIIAPTLKSMTLGAGEPLFFGYQPCSALGVPESLTGRAFVLSLYTDGAAVALGYHNANVVSDGADPVAVWRLDGTVSESFRGKSGTKFEIAELLDNGRDVIAIGDFNVTSTAPTVKDLDTAPQSRYMVRITRKNDADTIDAPSFSVKITPYNMSAILPAFTTAPSVTGSSTVGGTLTASDGVATASISARQWLLNSTAISGATGLTYVTSTAGAYTYRATSTNSTGSTSATSAAFNVAAAVVAPVNSTAPAISGTATTGQTLTATTGTWTNSPTSYAYQWLRAGASISAATAATYVLVSADEGTAITCRVTATNAGGSASATSNVITASAVVAPTVSISAAQTQLEGNTGTSAYAFTLTLTRSGSTAAYPYTWSVSGSGTNPANATDFGGTFPSGSGTFAAGETSKTITVLASGDTTVEPDETFTLTVTTTGLNTVSVANTITNDDTATATSNEASRFWLSGGGTTNSAGSIFQGESATLNVGTIQHVFELEGEFTEVQLILANQDSTDTQDYLGASMVAGTDISDKAANSLFSDANEVKTFAFGQNGNSIISVPARVNQNNQLSLSDWMPITAKQRTDSATAPATSKRSDGSLPFLLYVRLAIPIFKSDGVTNRRATYINRTGADWATGRGQLWASSDVAAAPILTGAWNSSKTFSSSNEGFINYAILAGVRYKSKGKVMTIMAGGSSFTSGGSDELKSHTGVQRGFQDASTAAQPVESVNYGMATNTADNASIGMIYALPIIKPTHVCWEYANPNSVGSWGSTQATADSIEANLELRRQQVFTAAQNVNATPFVINGTTRNTDATTSYFTAAQDGYRLAALARLNGRGFEVSDINAATTDGATPSRLKRTENGFAVNETSDFLHPNTAGYKKWSVAVAATTNTLKTTYFTQPIQAITSRNHFGNEGNATTASTNMDVCRMPATIGNAAVSSVGMVFSTYYGQNLKGSSHYLQAQVEYNGVTVVCTFGGANFRNMISGDVAIETDQIPASAFGVSQIPANAKIFTLVERTWTAGDSRITNGVPKIETGFGCFRGPTGSTSKIGSVGAITSAGGWIDYSARFFGPVVVTGRPVSFMPAVITVGASIESGTADDENRGYCVRAAQISPQYAHGLFSRGGETSTGYLSTDGDSRRAFYKYFNRAINGYGGNDFSGGTSKEISATNMATINAQLKAAGIQKIAQIRMSPKSDSTDSYVTTANQTVRTINGGFNVYRNYIDAQAALDPNMTRLVDMTAVQEPSGEPGKWVVNGTASYATADGTHPTAAIHALMTTPLRSAVDIINQA